eukprot:Platyproteum_vivax@DN7205_c0_g1_i1.p1
MVGAVASVGPLYWQGSNYMKKIFGDSHSITKWSTVTKDADDFLSLLAVLFTFMGKVGCVMVSRDIMNGRSLQKLQLTVLLALAGGAASCASYNIVLSKDKFLTGWAAAPYAMMGAMLAGVSGVEYASWGSGFLIGLVVCVGLQWCPSTPPLIVVYIIGGGVATLRTVVQWVDLPTVITALLTVGLWNVSGCACACVVTRLVCRWIGTEAASVMHASTQHVQQVKVLEHVVYALGKRVGPEQMGTLFFQASKTLKDVRQFYQNPPPIKPPTSIPVLIPSCVMHLHLGSLMFGNSKADIDTILGSPKREHVMKAMGRPLPTKETRLWVQVEAEVLENDEKGRWMAQQSRRTKCVKSSITEATWDESFEIPIAGGVVSANLCLRLRVLSWANWMSPKTLGQVWYPFGDITSSAAIKRKPIFSEEAHSGRTNHECDLDDRNQEFKGELMFDVRLKPGQKEPRVTKNMKANGFKTTSFASAPKRSNMARATIASPAMKPQRWKKRTLSLELETQAPDSPFLNFFLRPQTTKHEKVFTADTEALWDDSPLVSDPTASFLIPQTVVKTQSSCMLRGETADGAPPRRRKTLPPKPLTFDMSAASLASVNSIPMSVQDSLGELSASSSEQDPLSDNFWSDHSNNDYMRSVAPTINLVMNQASLGGDNEDRPVTLKRPVRFDVVSEELEASDNFYQMPRSKLRRDRLANRRATGVAVPYNSKDNSTDSDDMEAMEDDSPITMLQTHSSPDVHFTVCSNEMIDKDPEEFYAHNRSEDRHNKVQTRRKTGLSLTEVELDALQEFTS